MAGESRRAVAAAFLGNAALFVLKLVAALATGSAAMLAETFHSAADTGNQVLLFLGMRLARTPADDRHPFGYGQNVYFWAFVVSMLLFTLGGAFSMWEAVSTLRHPDAATHGNVAWAYGVLGGAFVFESISFAIAMHASRRAKQTRSWSEYLRETRDPTIATVLLEDSAALVSIVIAGAGITLTEITGTLAWDAIASAVIGVVLIGVAIFLAVENHSLLLGEAASADVQARIRRIVAADDAVVSVLELRTAHVGPDQIVIALGVKFRDLLTVPQVEATIGRLQRRIRDELGPVTSDALILIEPARTAQRGALGEVA